MKDDNYDIDEIRKYLLDKDSLLKQNIDQKLSEDPELDYEIKVQKILMAGMESTFDKELKKRLKSIDIEDKPKALIRWQKLAIAASIALISFFGYGLLQGPNYADIYQENYEPYINVVSEQHRGHDYLSAPQDPFRLYEQQKYNLAIASFEKMLTVSPSFNDTLSFYYGLSHLGNGSAPEAITILDQIPESSNFSESATWYKALAYLRLGEAEKSSKLFKKLSDQKTAYRNQARDILDSMD